MNEKKQNETLDEYINKCPLFNDYILKFHNIEIKRSKAYTLCEIDDVYIFTDFVLIGENKIRDSYGCHKHKDTQIKRFKRYENFISKELGCKGLPFHYFYAHFEDDLLHIEYEGMKEFYQKKPK